MGEHTNSKVEKMWVARDANGILTKSHKAIYLYKNKPFTSELKKGMWFCEGYNTELPIELFPNVTFESGPVEIELVIRK